jgi:SAM-dependent methyltransferase
MQENWFRKWFGEAYKALYPPRDEAEAECQAESLIRAAQAQTAWRILDVGCGGGRHLRALRKLGFERAAGVDLSQVLLRDARQSGENVTRADMRRLPFADATFDMLGCFFTSFGYFAKFAEDLAALGEFGRVVKPGGLLFLDLNNPEHVKRNLVARDKKRVGRDVVEQERSLQGDRVVKRIRIRTPEGSEELHEERVRLFSLADLQPEFAALRLSLESVLGDVQGREYRPESSPRMGLLLKRQGA